MRRGVGATEHAAQSPYESWCYHAHGLLYQRGARFFRHLVSSSHAFHYDITFKRFESDSVQNPLSAHTDIHAYTSTDRQTHINTDMHACTQPCTHACMHANMDTCIRAQFCILSSSCISSRVLRARLDNRIRSLRSLVAPKFLPVER